MRDPAAGIPAYSAAEPGAFPEEYLAARPQHLPVLRTGTSKLGIDAGPRCAAVARWTIHLGKLGGLLLPLQQQQGRPDPARTRPEAGPKTSTVSPTYPPPPTPTHWPPH